MTESNVIILVVTGTLCSTLGVYVAIRKVIQYTRPPVNTLVRTGDIELVDYVAPTRPHQTYNPIDLAGFEYPRFPRFSNYSHYYDRVSSFQNGNPPSYQSGTLPSYQSVDRFNINSCLENSFNLDYILWLILFFILVLLIRKLLLSYY